MNSELLYSNIPSVNMNTEQVHEHWTATYIVNLLNKTSNNIGRHRLKGYDRGNVFLKMLMTKNVTRSSEVRSRPRITECHENYEIHKCRNTDHQIVDTVVIKKLSMEDESFPTYSKTPQWSWRWRKHYLDCHAQAHTRTSVLLQIKVQRYRTSV